MIKRENKIQVSIVILACTYVITALGWFVAAYLLGRVQTSSVADVLSGLMMSICEVIFIGFGIGVIVNIILNRSLGSTMEKRIRQSGIDDIFKSRQDTAEYLLKIVKDSKRTKIIRIAGISLRDFLLGSGTLRIVWDAIIQRLESEAQSNMSDRERLHVEILLLDPRSGEGRFRQHVEKPTIGDTGLHSDVPHGLAEIDRLKKHVFQGNDSEFIQARLYHHCPFFFFFATDTQVLIEQYSYKDHTRHGPLPVLSYLSKSDQYNEFTFSFKKTWEASSIGHLDECHVCTDAAIEGARIENIFRRDDRGLLGRREAQVLSKVKNDDVVRIMAISGKFFISHPFFDVIRETGRRADIKFALINPVSTQAILRAIADTHHPGEIRQGLSDWTWEEHKKSMLYIDLHRTIKEITYWQEKKLRFKTNLVSSAASCAMLLTTKHAFVEQYVYGRSSEYQEGRVLGGEYPVFEFGRTYHGKQFDEQTMEQEILIASFEVVWNSFSMELDDYLKRNEQKDFELNISALRNQILSPDEVSSSKMNAESANKTL